MCYKNVLTALELQSMLFRVVENNNANKASNNLSVSDSYSQNFFFKWSFNELAGIIFMSQKAWI